MRDGISTRETWNTTNPPRTAIRPRLLAAACAAIAAAACAPSAEPPASAEEPTLSSTSLAISAPANGGDLVGGGGTVAAGAAHTCMLVNLATGGGVQCWGSNQFGQLGNGSMAPVAGRVSVAGLPAGVQAIVAGGYHTCALVNGGVRCWGRNDHGQVGTTSTPAIPVQVIASGVQAVAAGDLHTCALVNGDVWCWGSNSNGQLGPGAPADRNTPVQVTGLPSGVQAIAAGGIHTCALANGGVWCWGGNFNAQLGTGWPNDSSSPVAVPSAASGVQAIAAGLTHTCAMVNGGVICWGSDSNGQLGNHSTNEVHTPVTVVTSALQPLTGVQAIAAGSFHTCAIAGTGSVQCWGANDLGQLGNNDLGNDSLVPATAAPNGGQTLIAGYGHTCALVNGHLQCWGNDHDGQLGDQGVAPRPAPVQVDGVVGGVQAIAVGAFHTCALVNGGVMCWGDNDYGEVGDGTSGSNRLAPVPVAGLTTGVQAIAAGAFHTCALVNGGVMCWGVDLGDGTSVLNRLTPVPVAGLTTGVQAIAAGYYHTCALVNGGVMCWGYNVDGELGDGSSGNHRVAPVPVAGLTTGVQAIAAGGVHTCALVNGGMKCWGDNDYGEVGDGTSGSDRLAPVQVAGLTTGVQAIAAGELHTCARVNGGVKCWGYNGYGELGDGSSDNNRLAPVPVTGLTTGVQAIAPGAYDSFALVNGGVMCWGWVDGSSVNIRLAPVPVAGLTTGVQAIAVGLAHTCALVNGGVKCWGYNGYGELGDGTPTDRTVPVSVIGL